MTNFVAIQTTIILVLLIILIAVEQGVTTRWLDSYMTVHGLNGYGIEDFFVYIDLIKNEARLRHEFLLNQQIPST